jgi:hypothetical protein
LCSLVSGSFHFPDSKSGQEAKGNIPVFFGAQFLFEGMGGVGGVDRSYGGHKVFFPVHIVDGLGWAWTRQASVMCKDNGFRRAGEEVGSREGMGAFVGLHGSVGVMEQAVLELAEVGMLEDVVGGEVVLPQEECLMDREQGVIFIVGLGGSFDKPVRISGIVSG